MSAVNGDKARFNRRRRAKISRRTSNEQMLKSLAEKNLMPPQPTGPATTEPRPAGSRA